MVILHQKNEQKNISLDDFDSILGTPSTQKLFKLLVVWQKLSVKEIIEKIKISETQTYTILKNLEKIGIVEKKTRGIYSLTDNKFINLLKNAYSENLKEFLGKKLYQLSDILEENESELVIEEIIGLLKTWEPFLKEHFSHKLSTLSGHLIDNLIL